MEVRKFKPTFKPWEMDVDDNAKRTWFLEAVLDTCDPEKTLNLIQAFQNEVWPFDMKLNKSGLFSEQDSKDYTHVIGKAEREKKHSPVGFENKDVLRLLGASFKLKNHPTSQEHIVLVENVKKKNIAMDKPPYHNVARDKTTKKLGSRIGGITHKQTDMFDDFKPGDGFIKYMHLLGFTDYEGKGEPILDQIIQDYKQYVDEDGFARNIPTKLSRQLDSQVYEKGLKKRSDILAEHDIKVPVEVTEGDLIADVGKRLRELYPDGGDIKGISATKEGTSVLRAINYIANESSTADIIWGTADVLAEHYPNFHMSSALPPKRGAITPEKIESMRDDSKTPKHLLNQAIRVFARQNGLSYTEAYNRFEVEREGRFTPENPDTLSSFHIKHDKDQG